MYDIIRTHYAQYRTNIHISGEKAYFIYIIGNQIKTAQSHNAWDMMMAPNLSGKNLYASPHTMPATIAAMMSMKLNLEICTRLYTNVVTINPTVGVHRAEKRFWMHPLQKISSAGPIINSINRLSTKGFSPSFIPYMESTCGRAKSKSKVEKNSPSQNTPHRAAASTTPQKMSLTPKDISFHQPGRAQQVNRVSDTAEHVIITQKFTCGAVQGENIMVQSTVARTIPATSFFIDTSSVILEYEL